MQDTSLTPNTTDRPQAGEEPGKPLAPLWIFKIMNPVMKALLRSPLHRLLDGTLMLLTYTGRKTGKQHTIPIGYFVWGEGAVLVDPDPDRAVYRRYGLDKVLIALQRSGTFLIDKQGIVRYIHQVTNPQASVEKDELMREVEQL